MPERKRYGAFSNYDPKDMDDLMENAGRIGWSSLTFDQLTTRFDISRFPDYENMAEPYVGWIFMSRPDLNLIGDNLTILKNHPMTAMFMNDVYGERMMYQMSNRSYQSVSASNSQMWLPIITNRAMTYQTQDFGLKTVEKGNTFYGHVLKYGKHSEDHKTSGTITIDFRNDRQLSVMKMIYLWMAYIWIISRTGDISPTRYNEENGILDYAASLYYVVTRRDMSEIVYIEKLVGVFPTALPFSIFNYNDSMMLGDTLSVEFSYGIRCDPMDPAIMVDINYLSGLSYGDIVDYTTNKEKRSYTNRSQFGETFQRMEKFPNSKESPFALGSSLATAPFIEFRRGTQLGTMKYFLHFIDITLR